MKKKKVIACMMTAAFAFGMLAGCGNGNTTEDTAKDTANESGETTTIRFAWWGGQERADLTNAAVERFMEENPDIKVETSFYSYDSYWENLAIASTSGNVPDVYQSFVGSAEMQQFQDGGIVEPLGKYVEEGIIDTSAISDDLLAEGSVNGELYGLPFGTNARAMLVDTEVYEKAGLEIPEKGYESWEALEADFEKLKEATGKYATMDILGVNGDNFKYFCRQRGETLYSHEGDSIIGFSKDTFVDYYNMKLNWIEKGWMPPYDVSQAENGPEDSSFVKGESAVNVIPSNQYSQFADAAGKELEMILMPGASNSEATIVQASAHLSISSQSENKDAATKLLNFLINDAEANKLMKAERGIPAPDTVREAMKSDFNEGQKKAAVLIDQALEYSSPNDLPAMEGASDIQKFIMEYEERMIYGDVTPEEAYDAIAEEAKIN